MDTSFVLPSSSSSTSSASSSSLMYSTAQTDSLLVRSRDAIARLTNDLSVATSRIGSLENELTNLREQNTSLKKELTTVTVNEQSLNRILHDNHVQQQEMDNNYQQRLHTLENDLRTQKEATNAALVASQGAQLTAQSYENKYTKLFHEHSELQTKVQDKEQEAYTHRRLIGELRDRLTSALEERDEARHEIERLHHEIALLKQETKASDTSASTARNECRHALQRVQELENLVSKVENEAAMAREQAVAERTRSINLETNMKEALTRWLMSIRTKFAGIPVHPHPSSSSSSTVKGGSVPSSFGNTEIPLPPSPIIDATAYPPSDDKILAWLEALPDVAAWFQRASVSLTNQIEHRLQLASVAVDRLATRLVNHDNTEHRLCVNAQALAEQRGQEIDQLKKELIKYQNEIPPLKFSNTALEEEALKYQKIAQEAIERAERAEQQTERSRSMANEAALAADEAIAGKADLEVAMKRLQSAWEQRDRALRNEITSLENEFTAAERSWANELTETRERLATAIKRIKHTKQFVVPQAIKTSLASEIDRSGALVRDAQAVVRACRAHSERILTFLRSSNHGMTHEPAWMSQVRASMAAETSAAASFAEATENLTRVVQQYVAMGVNSTVQETIVAIGNEHGIESTSPVHTSLRDRVVAQQLNDENLHNHMNFPKLSTFVPSKSVPHTTVTNTYSSINNAQLPTTVPNMSYLFGNGGSTNPGTFPSSLPSTASSDLPYYPEPTPLNISTASMVHNQHNPLQNNINNNYPDYRLQQELLAYSHTNNNNSTIENNPFQNALPAHSLTVPSTVNTSTTRHRALQSGMVEYVQELTTGNREHNHHSQTTNIPQHNSTVNEPSYSSTVDHHHSSYRPIEEVESMNNSHPLSDNHKQNPSVPVTEKVSVKSTAVPTATDTLSPPVVSPPSTVVPSTTTAHVPPTVPVTQPLPPSAPSYVSQSSASVLSQSSASSTTPSVTLTNYEDNEWKLRRQRQLLSHSTMNNRLKALGLDASNTSLNGVPFQPLPISGALGGGVPFIGLQSATVQPPSH